MIIYIVQNTGDFCGSVILEASWFTSTAASGDWFMLAMRAGEENCTTPAPSGSSLQGRAEMQAEARAQVEEGAPWGVVLQMRIFQNDSPLDVSRGGNV